jgi:indoleamine 2,3-dioxygenase
MSTWNLSEFEIDPHRGFLPSEDPLRRLPSAFDAWEDLALGLPKALMTDRIRSLVERLPDFPVHLLQTEREWRRAMSGLSYLGHAYVWSGEAAQEIPAKLAVPWAEVAAHCGRPPILSYGSYALDNWFRFDPEGPIQCGNIGLIQNFWGGADEEWFILIHVDIEFRAARAVNAIPRAITAAENGDAGALVEALTTVRDSVGAMHETMLRMPEWCDPYIYFNRVRPYIHGWKNNPATPSGVRYIGVERFGDQPQLFRGETGAQSSIIPCLDGMLGVEHQNDPLKEYLMEMRTYQPPAHRAFLEMVESRSGVRAFVQSAGSAELSALYDEGVTAVENFRSLHLEYAAKYIFSQLQKDEKNPSQVGTGGTPFMVYLKKHRDETGQHALQGH